MVRVVVDTCAKFCHAEDHERSKYAWGMLGADRGQILTLNFSEALQVSRKNTTSCL